MVKDYQDEREDIKPNPEQKLPSRGISAMQGRSESKPAEDSSSEVQTNQVSPQDVQKTLGRDSLWKSDSGEMIEPKGNDGRGADYEKLKGANIAGTFEGIDDFDPDTGTATSMKTIDLNLPSYKYNPSRTKSTVNGYIDDLAEFPGAVSNQKGRRVEVLSEDIQQRDLSLGIPLGSCQGENKTALSECNQYAKSRNVNLKVDEVP